MAKRDRSAAAETEEERKERKRLKKEAKKRKKLDKAKVKEGGDVEQNTAAQAKTNTLTTQGTTQVFFRKKLALSISILPGSLGDVVKSIEDSLRKFLLKYSDGIEGVLLSFENVNILGKGSILNELPHIHYDVEVDAIVFRPNVGCHLSGLVTESSFHSHLSLVVNRYFNASISAEEMRKAGFDFDNALEHWYWKDGDTAKPIANDDTIDFVCQKIHESGGIVSLAGTKPVRSES